MRRILAITIMIMLMMSQQGICLRPQANRISQNSDAGLQLKKEQSFEFHTIIELNGSEEFANQLKGLWCALYFISTRYEVGWPVEAALNIIKKELKNPEHPGTLPMPASDNERFSLGEFGDWDQCLKAISYLFTGELLSEEELITRIKQKDIETEYSIIHTGSILGIVIGYAAKRNVFTYEELWHEFIRHLEISKSMMANLKVSATLELKDGSRVTIGPDKLIKPKQDKIPDCYGTMLMRVVNFALGTIDIFNPSAVGMPRSNAIKINSLSLSLYSYA